MKKKLFLTLFLILMSFSIAGCSDTSSASPDLATEDLSDEEDVAIEDEPSKEAEMPRDADEYVTDGWTVDDVQKELEDLGFSNITLEKNEIDGESPDGIDQQLTTVCDADSGLFSDSNWKAGDKIDKAHKIIIYYNKYCYLTPDNCEDFAKALACDDNIWEEFAKKYDGKFVVFEAVVDDAGDNNGLTTWSAVVRQEGSQGAPIHCSPILTTENVDESIAEGDRVIVKGRINYYKTQGATLYLSVEELKKI